MTTAELNQLVEALDLVFWMGFLLGGSSLSVVIILVWMIRRPAQ